jgi:hypothetical protein
MSIKDYLVAGAIVAAIPVGLGLFSTFSSVVTAPSRVINKTLETNNIISNYEFFHDANNQILARVAQVAEHKSLLTDVSDAAEKNRLRIELSAIKQSCRDLAGKYNANSAKVNRSIFKGRDAPETINLSVRE